MKYLDVALRVLRYAKFIFQNYSKTNHKSVRTIRLNMQCTSHGPAWPGRTCFR
jgi:hypothetical protein